MGLSWSLPGADIWFDHYFNGDGEELGLNGTSIHDSWASSSATIDAEIAIGSDLDANAAGACGTSSSFKFSGTADVDYAPGNWQVLSDLFPIGNTTLRFGGRCTASTTCTDTVIDGETSCEEECRKIERKKCTSVNCTGVLILYDRFEDVPDINDSEPGIQELPGGTAYTFWATKTFTHNSKKCTSSPACER